MNSTREILKIERSIVLRAPRARVWRALTRPQEFAQWFGVTIEGDFTPGARVTMVTTHPDYAGIVFPLYVQRIEPEHLFSWRWYPGSAMPKEEDPRLQTEVTFTLQDVPGGTRLTVVEDGFDNVKAELRAKAHQENTEGWEGQLKSIEVYVQSQT